MSIFGYSSPFAKFVNRLVDVIVLSLLTLLCSLPIVTIGASFSALYYVLLKMVRDQDFRIVHGFFKGFRENFWKGTALWLIMAVVIGILGMDFFLLSNIAMDYGDLVRILLVLISALVIMVGNYIFPMQAQFENTVFGTIKKAFIVCFMNLPRSIILLLIMGTPIVILLFFPETVYFLPVFCVAAIPYLKAEILIHVFAQYMPKIEEGDPDEEYVNRKKNEWRNKASKMRPPAPSTEGGDRPSDSNDDMSPDSSGEEHAANNEPDPGVVE
jgi:uncharacterized membrane protein YesL